MSDPVPAASLSHAQAADLLQLLPGHGSEGDDLPAGEVTKLLTAHRWREGDVEQLEAAVARLGVQVPGQGPQRL